MDPHTSRPDRAVGLTHAEATERLARDGANEVPEKSPHLIARLARKFWGLSAWMLELIAVLSLILGKRVDFGIALALLVVNATLSFFQEHRASAAVSALRRRLQITARVRRDGTWESLPARDLVQGDVVRVRAGDIVPADALLLDGELHTDQSALTGESQEIRKVKDDGLYAGSLVRQGEGTALVTATGRRTYFGRTAQLVETAHPQLHIEEVTSRLVKWLFAIVGTLVAVTVVLSLLREVPLAEVLPLSLVLLMSAVPVALPVMFTVSTAVGSMELGRRGVLVTHLSAVEDAANMDVLCADKTGTLTTNRLSVARVIAQPGFSEDDVLHAAALASNAANQDPIDVAFLAAASQRDRGDAAARRIAFVPFSPETRRTEAVVEVGGRRMRAVKGALRTLAELANIDRAPLSAIETQVTQGAEKGLRAIAVATGDVDGPLSFVGLVLLRDAPRPDSRALIDRLRSLGVRVIMLTGDALPVAQEIARELGIGHIVSASVLRVARPATGGQALDAMQGADGFAEVFPEDKFLIVKDLQAAGHTVGMTGDGVNDAPALRQAEVGIAVSGATDVAKSAASIVLMTEGLTGIIDMVRVGRSIYQRVLTWIINKVSRTILKAGLVVVAFLATGQFVISALGMVLLVFMTDFVKVSLSTDRVHPSQKPETWNIGPLVNVAVALGLLMLGEALGLLAIGWHSFALDQHPGELQTFTFLTLLFFALFSIVSIRERRAFWTSRPAPLLAVALAADALAGIAIGVWGLAELRPLPLEQMGMIVSYALVCCLGPNDAIKSWLIARFWTAAEDLQPQLVSASNVSA